MIARTLAAAALLLAGGATAQASVLISGNPTSNMSCVSGVCTPTAKKAVLNTIDLTNMLATGDVTVNTASGARTITVLDTFSWTNTSTLTLTADQSVSFKASVVVAGAGGLSITTGGPGDLLFFGGSSVSFFDLSSSLFIQGDLYKLEPDLDQLAGDLSASGATGFYALANDFDLSGHTYNASPINAAAGNYTLEGMGHAVSSLHITGATGCIGLIGQSDGLIRDLRMTKVRISATGANDIGAIAGCANNLSLINDTAQGTLKSGDDSRMGGLVGDGGTLFRNSSTAVKITGGSAIHFGSYLGGIVGIASQGVIENSHASGKITGGVDAIAGGLAGAPLSVTLSYATGAVSVAGGSKARAGGLVGVGSTIDQSFASGAIGGGTDATVGGLAGQASAVTNSYASGSVQCGDACRAGGLAGLGHDITDSYSTGLVTGGVAAQVGGFIGRDDARDTLANDYWNLDTSGVSDPSRGAGNKTNDTGIAGLSTSQFKSGLPSGFDNSVWREHSTVNDGYPYLLNNPPQ